MTDRNPLSRARRAWVLFRSMLFISAFTFGGGFVIVSLMKKKFVDELGWIDEPEMLDMIALAQSAPGPIAVNAAILAGWKTAGAAGMIAAVLGTLLPPMAVLSLLSVFYNAFSENRWVALALKGMQAGVAAVIADVTCGLAGNLVRQKDRARNALALAAFAAVFFLRVNAVWIILAAAATGVARALARRKGAKA